MNSHQQASLPPYIDRHAAQAADVVLRQLQRYHRHRVDNLAALDAPGPLLLVVHHSLATYDIALLGYAVYKRYGRVPRALADRLIFRVPPVAWLVRGVGGVEGEPQTATALLRAGHIVMVAPGGMREALRPSSARYDISWDGRLGFARLAITTGTPVVCAACPAADDLYDVYPNRLTEYCLKKFHVPVPLLRGRGPTLMPRPLQLVHYLSQPLAPPPAAEAAADPLLVQQFQQRVAACMRSLLRHPR